MIFEYAKQPETQLSYLEESINNMRCIDGGRMRIGVIRTAEYFMSKEIAVFLRVHLEIHLDLKVDYRLEFVTGLC